MSKSVRDLGLVVIGAGQVVLRSGEALSEATEFVRHHGGDTALAAMACAAEGVDTAFVTRVGDDPFTSWLLETWDAAPFNAKLAAADSKRMPRRDGVSS